jgi:uncharacterized protein (DUF697 family)
MPDNVGPDRGAEGDDARIETLLHRAQEDSGEALDPANIVVIGNTGVGKSTLINAVFRERVADAGTGSPVTQDIECHEVPGLPVRIYDTPGLELQDSAQRLIGAVQGLSETSRTGDPRDLLHLAWFCFNGRATRFAEEERRAIEGVARHVPVVLVGTQVADPGDAALTQLLAHIAPSALPVAERRAVLTLAEPLRLGTVRIEEHGLDELIAVTRRTLPEATRLAFTNAVRATEATLSLKSEEARIVVVQSTAAAAAAGAIPIPVADAVPLVAIQVTMIGRINSVFGLELSRNEIATLFTTLAGGRALSLVGRWLAGQAADLVPVAGQVVNATVAATLTYCFGEAYIATCRAIMSARAKGETLAMEEAARILMRTMPTFADSQWLKDFLRNR